MLGFKIVIVAGWVTALKGDHTAWACVLKYVHGLSREEVRLPIFGAALEGSVYFFPPVSHQRVVLYRQKGEKNLNNEKLSPFLLEKHRTQGLTNIS